ncbi:MAG: cache domain-containing protein [Acidobacteriota bacterium]|nr:cache domain-containing protein [Acidobacteriota bacterium]
MIKRFRKSNIRFKLIFGLLSIVLIMGALSTSIGINIINNNVIREANDTVRNSLDATELLYQEEITRNSRIIEYLSRTIEIVRATSAGDRSYLFERLVQIKNEFGFDIVNVVNPDGTILVRANNFDAYGDSIAHYRYIQWVMEKKSTAAGTGTLGYENIKNEGKDLAERTLIKVVPTPRARKRESSVETRALVIKMAAPIMSSGRMIGIFYAAILLNNNEQFIDRFKKLAFKEEKIKGKDVGTNTIFLDDLRIATNVIAADGRRAIGTQVSEEVYKRVYEGGKRWLGRAFVVDSWYLAGYSPIMDIDGKPLGILYVGILKDKFDILVRKTTISFLLVIAGGMLSVLLLAIYLIELYTKPIKRIIDASGEIAGGFYHKVEVGPNDDEYSRNLGNAFNAMVEAIEERDRWLTERAEKTILISEKLASIGRLASGMAHEINNPLTGILTFSSLLLKELKGTPCEADLRVIRDETLRCRSIVRRMLDFSRESKPAKERADINQIIEESLLILEKHVNFQNIVIEKNLDPAIPRMLLDVNQIKSVINNLCVNAADAMPEGGRLTIISRWRADDAVVEIRIKDTGVGISPENMNKIFEPFFTTKEVGKGTGLGLAMTYGIIRGHNGTIDVESKLGTGTEFTIRLPLEVAGDEGGEQK